MSEIQNKLIDIDGLGTFKDKMDSVIEEKISEAGVGVKYGLTKETNGDIKLSGTDGSSSTVSDVVYFEEDETSYESNGTNLMVSDIVDNLNSSENNKVLSANQGKVLNDHINTVEGMLNARSFAKYGITNIFSVPTGGTVQLPLNRVWGQYDPNHDFELTADGGAKCNFNGIILVTASIYWDGTNLADQHNVQLWAYRNNYRFIQQNNRPSVGGQPWTQATTTILQVSKGDVLYIKPATWSNGLSVVELEIGTFLSLVRMI